MDPRAASLIASLRLTTHPEGGYYREIYRSTSHVQPLDGRPPRLALTAIYFLLPAGEVSRWHRVASDEVWTYHEGAALELCTVDEAFGEVSRRVLGSIGDGRDPQLVVPAWQWQAARSTGAYTLVGCTVGPGFEFADFALLRDRPEDAARARLHPDVAAFL